MKKVLRILFYIMAIALALAFIFPLGFAIYNSLLPLDKVNKLVALSDFTLENYIEIFTEHPIMTWIKNTVIVAGLTLLCQLITALTSGYALAKLRFPGNKCVFMIVLVTLMIPFQVLLTPLYIMVVKLGWNDSLVGLIVPFMLNSLYVFMARQFFMTIPTELIEAARIDGLSHAGCFFKIVLPLSKPIITTITIFNFTLSWNAYLVPSTFVGSPEKYTLVVGLSTLKDTFFTKLNMTMAGVVLTSIPILILFLILQKQFIQAVVGEGIKG